MTHINAIMLGIIQGITEFFPISSSAHLIAARFLFGITDSALGNLTFDIALHFGTLMAIVIYFFKDLMLMLKDGFKFKKNGVYSFGVLSSSGKLLWYIAVACIPAGIAGVLFDDIIEEFIRESVYAPLIIAGTLSIMGVVIYYIDKHAETLVDLEHMTLKQALLIGIGQMFAIIPGFSRSGTTIMMARSQKLDRVSAAKFSFLLGVPVMAGAAVLKFKDLTLSMIDLNFILGVITSFVFGMLCIKVLMVIVKNVGFEYFAVYRIVLSIILVVTYIVR